MDSLIHRYAAIVLLSIGMVVNPVQAQVVPDNTLPMLVSSPDNRNFAIDGGSRSGSNLFHSFSQFSVPTGGAAIFNNALDVQNIFSRVTGGTVSNIDGLIQARGNANLFLLNPSGIIFGPNAKLNIGGSFLGTTASSIQFTDGGAFSTTNPAPLLTMSVPIGLQMGQTLGAITVQGNGHSLSQPPAPVAVIGAGKSNSGLIVRPGNTIALVGSTVNLAGGIVAAPQGRIEVGSVGSGSVGLIPVAAGWQLDYSSIDHWQDIQLSQRALFDASGPGGGNIQVAGRRIELSQGSSILLQNQGNLAANQIRVQASESLQLQDIAPNNFWSSITSEAVNRGNGADIVIVAPNLTLQNNGRISALTHNAAQGGNLSIASAQIMIDGQFDRVLGIRSGLANTATGSGRMGDTTISTQQLVLRNGGLISASTRGSDDGGELLINASEFVEVNGINLLPGGQPSLITSSSLSRGNAGNLTINTPRLGIYNSGQISVSALAQGNGGNLLLNIADLIEVSGQIAPFVPSRIDASATIIPPLIRVVLRVPDVPSGKSGNIEITTQTLRLSDGGSVLARNEGNGGAGKITIQSDKIQLMDRGKITAASASGQGGDITLNAPRLLFLRNDSQISTESKGIGNGGNITINTPIIVGWDNSDIDANAAKGQGGNIAITAQGVFGLKFRGQLTPENDITASSEFGINGTVQINTIGIDPNSGLTALPVDIVDPSQKIATGCAAQRDSSFVATGRGGIPENPMQVVAIDRTWSDLRAIAHARPEPKIAGAAMPFEATALATNAQGQIELIGEGALAAQIVATCAK